MKTMYLLIMLLPLAFIQPAEAQKLSKEEKAAQAAKEWEGTRQLIEGRQFNMIPLQKVTCPFLDVPIGCLMVKAGA